MSLLQVANTLITSGNEAQIIKLQNCITTDDVYMLVGSNIQVGGSGGILRRYRVHPSFDRSYRRPYRYRLHRKPKPVAFG